jgi:hypothetical protein
MTKKLIDDKKIVTGIGADEKFHLEIECSDFGTMHFVGDDIADCIAQLLDKLSELVPS